MVQKALSDLAIANLKTEGYYWDKVPGFGVRKGKKRTSFICVRNGRRVTLGVYPHLSLADARQLALQQLYTTNSIQPKSVPVHTAVVAYLAQLRLKPRTVADYTRFLTLYLLPKLGTKDVSKIVHADILAITDPLLDTPTECRHCYAAMQTFFNWCVPRYIKISPMAGLKSPTKPKRRSRVLTDAELKAIWQASIEDSDLAPQFRAIVQLLIYTGQRRGETAALQGVFYSHNQQTITLPETLTKNKRLHTFPLCSQARDLVEKYRNTKGLWLPVQGKDGNPAVFSAWSKNKKLLDNLSKVSGWTLHDLRRTYRSRLGQLGVRPDYAERLVNHVSARNDMEETYDLYTYLPEMAAAAQKLGDYLESKLQSE